MQRYGLMLLVFALLLVGYPAQAQSQTVYDVYNTWVNRGEPSYFDFAQPVTTAERKYFRKDPIEQWGATCVIAAFSYSVGMSQRQAEQIMIRYENLSSTIPVLIAHDFEALGYKYNRWNALRDSAHPCVAGSSGDLCQQTPMRNMLFADYVSQTVRQLKTVLATGRVPVMYPAGLDGLVHAVAIVGVTNDWLYIANSNGARMERVRVNDFMMLTLYNPNDSGWISWLTR